MDREELKSDSDSLLMTPDCLLGHFYPRAGLMVSGRNDDDLVFPSYLPSEQPSMRRFITRDLGGRRGGAGEGVAMGTALYRPGRLPSMAWRYRRACVMRRLLQAGLQQHQGRRLPRRLRSVLKKHGTRRLQLRARLAADSRLTASASQPCQQPVPQEARPQPRAARCPVCRYGPRPALLGVVQVDRQSFLDVLFRSGRHGRCCPLCRTFLSPAMLDTLREQRDPAPSKKEMDLLRKAEEADKTCNIHLKDLGSRRSSPRQAQLCGQDKQKEAASEDREDLRNALTITSITKVRRPWAEPPAKGVVMEIPQTQRVQNPWRDPHYALIRIIHRKMCFRKLGKMPEARLERRVQSSQPLTLKRTPVKETPRRSSVHFVEAEERAEDLLRQINRMRTANSLRNSLTDKILRALHLQEARASKNIPEISFRQQLGREPIPEAFGRPSEDSQRYWRGSGLRDEDVLAQRLEVPIVDAARAKPVDTTRRKPTEQRSEREKARSSLQDPHVPSVNLHEQVKDTLERIVMEETESDTIPKRRKVHIPVARRKATERKFERRTSAAPQKPIIQIEEAEASDEPDEDEDWDEWDDIGGLSLEDFLAGRTGLDSDEAIEYPGLELKPLPPSGAHYVREEEKEDSKKPRKKTVKDWVKKVKTLFLLNFALKAAKKEMQVAAPDLVSIISEKIQDTENQLEIAMSKRDDESVSIVGLIGDVIRKVSIIVMEEQEAMLMTRIGEELQAEEKLASFSVEKDKAFAPPVDIVITVSDRFDEELQAGEELVSDLVEKDEAVAPPVDMATTVSDRTVAVSFAPQVDMTLQTYDMETATGLFSQCFELEDMDQRQVIRRRKNYRSRDSVVRMTEVMTNILSKAFALPAMDAEEERSVILEMVQTEGAQAILPEDVVENLITTAMAEKEHFADTLSLEEMTGEVLGIDDHAEEKSEEKEGSELLSNIIKAVLARAVALPAIHLEDERDMLLFLMEEEGADTVSLPDEFVNDMVSLVVAEKNKTEVQSSKAKSVMQFLRKEDEEDAALDQLTEAIMNVMKKANELPLASVEQEKETVLKLLEEEDTDTTEIAEDLVDRLVKTVIMEKTREEKSPNTVVEFAKDVKVFGKRFKKEKEAQRASKIVQSVVLEAGKLVSVPVDQERGLIIEKMKEAGADTASISSAVMEELTTAVIAEQAKALMAKGLADMVMGAQFSELSGEERRRMTEIIAAVILKAHKLPRGSVTTEKATILELLEEEGADLSTIPDEFVDKLVSIVVAEKSRRASLSAKDLEQMMRNARKKQEKLLRTLKKTVHIVLEKSRQLPPQTDEEERETVLKMMEEEGVKPAAIPKIVVDRLVNTVIREKHKTSTLKRVARKVLFASKAWSGAKRPPPPPEEPADEAESAVEKMTEVPAAPSPPRGLSEPALKEPEQKGLPLTRQMSINACLVRSLGALTKRGKGAADVGKALRTSFVREMAAVLTDPVIAAYEAVRLAEGDEVTVHTDRQWDRKPRLSKSAGAHVTTMGLTKQTQLKGDLHVIPRDEDYQLHVSASGTILLRQKHGAGESEQRPPDQAMPSAPAGSTTADVSSLRSIALIPSSFLSCSDEKLEKEEMADEGRKEVEDKEKKRMEDVDFRLQTSDFSSVGLLPVSREKDKEEESLHTRRREDIQAALLKMIETISPGLFRRKRSKTYMQEALRTFLSMPAVPPVRSTSEGKACYEEPKKISIVSGLKPSPRADRSSWGGMTALGRWKRAVSLVLAKNLQEGLEDSEETASPSTSEGEQGHPEPKETHRRSSPRHRQSKNKGGFNTDHRFIRFLQFSLKRSLFDDRATAAWKALLDTIAQKKSPRKKSSLRSQGSISGSASEEESSTRGSEAPSTGRRRSDLLGADLRKEAEHDVQMGVPELPIYATTSLRLPSLPKLDTVITSKSATTSPKPMSPVRRQMMQTSTETISQHSPSYFRSQVHATIWAQTLTQKARDSLSKRDSNKYEPESEELEEAYVQLPKEKEEEEEEEEDVSPSISSLSGESWSSLSREALIDASPFTGGFQRRPPDQQGTRKEKTAESDQSPETRSLPPCKIESFAYKTESIALAEDVAVPPEKKDSSLMDLTKRKRKPSHYFRQRVKRFSVRVKRLHTKETRAERKIFAAARERRLIPSYSWQLHKYSRPLGRSLDLGPYIRRMQCNRYSVRKHVRSRRENSTLAQLEERVRLIRLALKRDPNEPRICWHLEKLEFPYYYHMKGEEPPQHGKYQTCADMLGIKLTPRTGEQQRRPLGGLNTPSSLSLSGSSSTDSRKSPAVPNEDFNLNCFQTTTELRMSGPPNQGGEGGRGGEGEDATSNAVSLPAGSPAHTQPVHGQGPKPPQRKGASLPTPNVFKKERPWTSLLPVHRLHDDDLGQRAEAGRVQETSDIVSSFDIPSPSTLAGFEAEKSLEVTTSASSFQSDGNQRYPSGKTALGFETRYRTSADETDKSFESVETSVMGMPQEKVLPPVRREARYDATRLTLTPKPPDSKQLCDSARSAQILARGSGRETEVADTSSNCTTTWRRLGSEAAGTHSSRRDCSELTPFADASSPSIISSRRLGETGGEDRRWESPSIVTRPLDGAPADDFPMVLTPDFLDALDVQPIPRHSSLFWLYSDDIDVNWWKDRDESSFQLEPFPPSRPLRPTSRGSSVSKSRTSSSSVEEVTVTPLPRRFSSPVLRGDSSSSSSSSSLPAISERSSTSSESTAKSSNSSFKEGSTYESAVKDSRRQQPTHPSGIFNSGSEKRSMRKEFTSKTDSRTFEGKTSRRRFPDLRRRKRPAWADVPKAFRLQQEDTQPGGDSRVPLQDTTFTLVRPGVAAGRTQKKSIGEKTEATVKTKPSYSFPLKDAQQRDHSNKLPAKDTTPTLIRQEHQSSLTLKRRTWEQTAATVKTKPSYSFLHQGAQQRDCGYQHPAKVSTHKACHERKSCTGETKLSELSFRSFPLKDIQQRDDGNKLSAKVATPMLLRRRLAAGRTQKDCYEQKTVVPTGTEPKEPKFAAFSRRAPQQSDESNRVTFSVAMPKLVRERLQALCIRKLSFEKKGAAPMKTKPRGLPLVSLPQRASQPTEDGSQSSSTAFTSTPKRKGVATVRTREDTTTEKAVSLRDTKHSGVALPSTSSCSGGKSSQGRRKPRRIKSCWESLPPLLHRK